MSDRDRPKLERDYFDEARKGVKLLVEVDDDRADAIVAMCLLPILKMSGEDCPTFFERLAREADGAP